MSLTITEEELMDGERTGNYRKMRNSINGEMDAVQRFALKQPVARHLEKVKDEDIKRMQSNLAKLAPRFIFSAHETAGDSLDVFLRRMYADSQL